ncbi:MAG: PAS domain S-box protein, partial [Proteobacteria bacterium]|nr:PAS domain S-box protein [Pseudomonadota bacterium]
NIIIFNQGAESLFGYSKDEVIGKMDIRSLYPPEIAEEIMQNFYSKEHETKGMHRWRETFVLGKGGHKIPVRFSGSILYRNGEVIGSVGFFNDLREIKRLEHELIKSERLAATGQTAVGLAHCIKNIVVALEGGVDIVNVALEKNNMSNISIGWDLVQRNIGKVSSLVLDLLSFSKDRKPEYEKCLPNIIANEARELMDSEAKKAGIEIAGDFDPNIGEASLDPKGIHRCLLNLITNAIDACESDKDKNKKHLVRVTTKRERNGMITFQVSDNGCGMSEEVRRQIFTSFFSTKGSKGTGLGLLITQKIVQEHGGTIKVKSEVGLGTSFELKFPARSDS